MRDAFIKLHEEIRTASPEKYKEIIGRPGLKDEDAERLRTAYFEMIEEPSQTEARKKAKAYRSLLSELSITIDSGKDEE